MFQYFMLVDSALNVLPLEVKGEDIKTVFGDKIELGKIYRFKKKSEFNEFMKTYFNSKGNYEDELPGNLHGQ